MAEWFIPIPEVRGSNWQVFNEHYITVYCSKKTKIIQKEAENGPFLTNICETTDCNGTKCKRYLPEYYCNVRVWPITIKNIKQVGNICETTDLNGTKCKCYLPEYYGNVRVLPITIQM